jgi:hypothetical protein
MAALPDARPVWFSDFTMLDDGTKTTVAEDSPFRTYMDINIHPIVPEYPDKPIDIYENHPWKHPGKAPVWSPCGIGGGNPRGCYVPGTTTPTPCPAGAESHGKDARFFEFPDVKTTVWKIGGIAETAWQVNANHGGGYSYRLCPLQTATQPPGFPIDEACFQSHTLDFVGEKQWFQFGSNRSTRALFGDIPAMTLSEGTWPIGSQWRRNPVPACHGPGAANAYGRGGGNQTSFPNAGGTYSCSKESYRCPPKSISDPTPSPPCDGDTSKFAWNGTYSGPQFDPVGGYPGKYASEGIYTYGFGNNQGQNAGGEHMFVIVDQVQVPQDIDPGLYVLSHRYDCEQTTRERPPACLPVCLPAAS